MNFLIAFPSLEDRELITIGNLMADKEECKCSALTSGQIAIFFRVDAVYRHKTDLVGSTGVTRIPKRKGSLILRVH